MMLCTHEKRALFLNKKCTGIVVTTWSEKSRENKIRQLISEEIPCKELYSTEPLNFKTKRFSYFYSQSDETYHIISHTQSVP